jgi:CheY-like chemotaxis protein
MSPMPTETASRKIVMLVEDDDDMRDALATLLEEHHYGVLQAANGAEALRLLEGTKGECHVILLDLMMPVMNGWDFRRQQKRQAQLADIPVVLMSSGAQIAFSSEDMDVAGYVSKPVELSDLLEKLQLHCR